MTEGKKLRDSCKSVLEEECWIFYYIGIAEGSI